MTIEMNRVYAPSDDVVAREIEGELIIIPLVSGMGDLEDELYTLNETGKAIWDLLDSKRSLDDITTALGEKYESSLNEIEKDVIGLVEELVKRRMLIEVIAVG
jgi:hypothetical protein